MTARVLGVSAVFAAVAAAGVGGYLAGRPSTATPSAQPTATSAPAPASPAARAAAVTETEGVVSPASTTRPAPTAAASNNAASTSVPSTSASTPVERQTPTTSAAGRNASAARPSAPAAATSKASPPASGARPSGPDREPISNARADVRTPSQPAPTTTVARDEPRPAVPEPVAHDSSAIEPPRDVKPAEERPAAVVEPPPPPTPRIEEYVVPADSVIGLQLDETVSTDTARVEQRVEAHVARDVRVNGAIVIPAGSRAHGQVTLVESGGKFRDRARLGIRFHTLVLAEGDSIPIQTDTIYREGDAVGQRSAARIGGSAVGGAIIGAIFGGGKGAAIGAAAGASAGTAATMGSQKSQVTLHVGSSVTVRLTSPTTVSVEREN